MNEVDAVNRLQPYRVIVVDVILIYPVWDFYPCVYDVYPVHNVYPVYDVYPDIPTTFTTFS